MLQSAVVTSRISRMSMLIRSGFGEGLVEGVLPDDFPQGGLGDLGDLVDRGPDVLDRDHRLHRVDDAVVGDGGHVDADVCPA